MSATLYRKYRPKNFSEVIGQTHIVRTLSNAIKNGRIGQAYLFTGPRGTGKTSIARILAKTVNCSSLKNSLPCEKCASCQIINSGKSMDIIEIDAASNTGVDNIRELRETIALASASLKYKVYIIDEVHMLSSGAFNALLKTLEEPPTHVIFILATTEIHKVPETILSRCQRFDFTRLPLPDIIKKLSLIAGKEKVKIEKEALEMIAIAAEGGMRDAESLLEQIISLEDKNITAKETEEILGTTDKKQAAEIAEMIVKNDSSGAIARINELLENGYDLQIFNKTLVNYLRQLMLIKISPELKKYFTYEMASEQLEKIIALSEISELPRIISAINLFLDAQSKISASILPQLPLEIAIIKATRTFPVESSEYKVESINPNKNIPYNKSSLPPSGESARRADEGLKEKTKIKNTDFQPETDPSLPENTESNIDLYSIKQNWNKLLVDIRPYNHSLSALLSNCQPIKVENGKIILATPYSFYGERLNETKNKLTIEEVLGKILKSKIRISVAVDKNLILKKPAETEIAKNSEQNSLLDSALEIMGGKVVDGE